MQSFEDSLAAAVEVAFAGPVPQRRLTVAFRIVLAIPHLIASFLLWWALAVCELLGWFAALVTGRLPKGMADFVTGCVRYYTRLTSYLYLLTDRYPPFSLSAGGYPVEVRVSPGRLNRLAVLFRLLLTLPAYLALGILSNGVSIAIFFVWLIVLVAGTMPASLYQALAAVVRYQARFYSYLGLLTGAYPSRLLGDPPSTGRAAESLQPASLPATPAAGYRPGGEIVPPGGGSSWWDSLAAAAPPDQYPPLAERLVLTTAARRIVVLFVVLGVLSWGGSVAADVAIGSGRVNDLEALSTLDTDYGELAAAVDSFQRQTSSCQQSGAGLPCVEQADAVLAPAFSRFAERVAALQVPAQDLGDAKTVVGDARRLSSDLGRLASEPSASAYVAASAEFRSDGTTFDNDVEVLRQDLLS